MKSNTKEPSDLKSLDAVRYDGKRWRRLVSKCADADELVSPSTEEQYKVVHGRILARCRSLADEESLPKIRRRIALELDDLLRPWSTTKSLTDAPTHLVEDLVRQEATLEDKLRGKLRSRAAVRMRRLTLTACVAATVGIAMVLLLSWSTSNASIPLFSSLWGVGSRIADYIRHTSFAEQFAIAVLISWLFGTWLLSKVSPS